MNQLDQLLIEAFQYRKASAASSNLDVKCFTALGTLAWYGLAASRDAIQLIDPGIMVLPRNFLTTVLMKLWLACALERECIAPVAMDQVHYQRRRLSCDTLCDCHKYDVSALSIINHVFLDVLF